VRLPRELGNSLNHEQPDMSRCAIHFKSPNDSGSFDILEQPDKDRYCRHPRLPIDSGSAEISEDPFMFRYCSFDRSVIHSGRLSFFILGAIRHLSCFSLPIEAGNNIPEHSLKSKVRKHFANENEPLGISSSSPLSEKRRALILEGIFVNFIVGSYFLSNE
jgi:hypothetical protein